ncbi:acetyl-CoA hydrolase/transferase family protein [Alicyclobacillus sp. SO9]|uniref:acetyl-CoA hydrolase/transferase family protein n=1 Tax=Alicyclobacillus sp. SO9 TaxID=2665646 RepID=UPI0018E728D7|nr:acetyl-CoA hydrolase/transferase family protein [Alicyclobacillus sp. SO9]QQE79073.1 acetyl-CoA hydrolase/transferase family protein [Alicyclobacillus sp. SO9]
MEMVTLEQAMSHIQSGMRVYTQGMASTPHYLLNGFADRCYSLEDAILYHLHLEGETPWVVPELKGHVRDISLFVGANLRAAVNEGRASYAPIFLSEVPWFLEQQVCRPNVAFLNVSPPDRHGYVSLGPTMEAMLTAVREADLVIAQVNRHVPRALGDALLPESAITYGVRHDEPLSVISSGTGDEVTEAIGKYVADLVPDRATLQLGIGKIPDAVLRELVNHKDLGIHSEMISDGVRMLAERGVITGRYKETDKDQIVFTFAMGSAALYDFIDDNPMVSLRSVDYTNNTAVIRRNPRMMSINSAIEVDLTGQVVAESIGTQVVSGVGGQMDFVRGASLAPEGKSIIALPSRTHSGQSRIVPTLHAGAGVTTTRNHVQYVATEYGVASLHGSTLEARARALIDVAHPDDRAMLEEAAHAMLAGFK